jgi:hypothetical protein
LRSKDYQTSKNQYVIFVSAHNALFVNVFYSLSVL